VAKNAIKGNSMNIPAAVMALAAPDIEASK
jgi:hypothetical protein